MRRSLGHLHSHGVAEKIAQEIHRITGLPPAVKASVAFAACNVVQKGIVFIFTTPIFTRLLNTEQYGQYTLYQSWLSVLNVFATLSLSGAVFDSGLLDYEKDQGAFTAAMQGLSSLATLCVAATYFLFKPFWRQFMGLPDIAVYAMLLELLFIPAFRYWSMRQRFHYRYRALVAVTISIALAQSVLGIWAVLCTEEKGIARILSVSLVNAFVGLCFYVYNFAWGRRPYVREYWKFALRFNIPLIPYYLSQFILMQSDRIMIAYYLSEAEAGIYGLAYQISMAMNLVADAVLASLVPWLYRSMRKEEYARIRQVTNGLLGMMGVFVLIPVLLAPEAIGILGTEEYMGGKWLIPPIAASVFFTFYTWFFIRLEFYFQETKFVAVSTVFSAVLNIGLNVVFIPKFGYIAAAYTTLACYMVYAAAHYGCMRYVCAKHHAPRGLYNIRAIAASSLAVLAGAGAVMSTYSNSLLRWGLIAGLCVSGILLYKKLLKGIGKR